MLFSGKENFFMCLVAFQKMFWKIFSDVWLYSWKYHKKHIFYLLLTFSHIFSVTKRIYNIIYSSKHKQNPEKNHQIQTNEGEITVGASGNRDRRVCAMRQSWSREDRRIARRSKRRSRSWSALPRQPMMSADGDVAIDSFFLPLSLSLSLSLSSIFQGRKLFEVKMETEMIFRCFGSHFRSIGNAFQFDRIWSNNQTPHFSKNHFWNQFEVNSNAT